MAAPTFNLTANAERKAFALYIDVSESSTPEWEVQGYGTEDASVAFSPDTSSLIDILGIQHNQVNSLTRAMSITPNTIRPIENFGKLNELLHEYTRRNQLTKLSTFKVLLVYWYTTNSAADLYPTCTVVPGTSITYTFSALLSIDVGDTYKVIVNPTLDNHTGKEEIILEIGGTALPAVDNLGRYVTAQMFRNPKKRCHFDCDRFRVQIVANGATKAAAIRCGLSCRRSWLDVVTPPTP